MNIEATTRRWPVVEVVVDRPRPLSPHRMATMRRPPGTATAVANRQAGKPLKLLVLDERIRASFRPEETLVLRAGLDPMLYFWPVGGAQVAVIARNIEGAHAERLVHALLRDGAERVALLIPRGTTFVRARSRTDELHDHAGEDLG